MAKFFYLYTSACIIIQSVTNKHKRKKKIKLCYMISLTNKAFLFPLAEVKLLISHCYAMQELGHASRFGPPAPIAPPTS